jgi:adenine/guanine phosphoribosyltransferase-like PRPP-binding protein
MHLPDKEQIQQSRKEAFRFSTIHDVTWAEIDAFSLRYASLSASFDLLIGVLRYGAPIVTALSRATGLPHDYVLFSGNFPEPTWLGDVENVPKNMRLLLVDDTCGTGATFIALKQFFEAHGNQVQTMSMFYSKERYIPDYGTEISADTYVRWPWQYGADPYLPEIKEPK